jgi:hypothetical protein
MECNSWKLKSPKKESNITKIKSTGKSNQSSKKVQGSEKNKGNHSGSCSPVAADTMQHAEIHSED